MSNKFKAPEFSGYICVGYIPNAHGIRGEIYLRLYASEADWLDSLKTVFLLRPGLNGLEPWLVEAGRAHKEGLILKLKGSSDRNFSETLVKSGVYISTELLQSAPGEAIFLKQILNFTLLDPSGRPLGQIIGFATNGPQDLLRVALPTGGEALVPFVDAFIVHIDFDKQQIKMDLPQGLLNPEEL